MADLNAAAGPSIRAQAQKSKKQQNNGGSKLGADRSVVKAVLANPLTVPWPSIPKHLQITVLANLPAFIPTEVAAYHTDRARCHQADKRNRRSVAKEEAVKEEAAVPGKGIGEVEADEGAAAAAARSAKKRDAEPASDGPAFKRVKSSSTHPPNVRIPSTRPDKPATLPHLVFGINEVIKSLESQTNALRFRVMLIGDALAEQQKGGKQAAKSSGGRVLLPTAPPREEDEASSGEEEVDMAETADPIPTNTTLPPSADSPKHLSSPVPPAAPLEWIIIPLLSISPATLVSPIPAYCATYNTLVYQHTHISKIARTRFTATRADELVGEAVEEVRVVPLGKVEEELAALAGLRRVASLAIRSSHPAIETLRKILPKSMLHPPRHSLTLPFPTSALTVTSAPTLPTPGDESKERPARKPPAQPKTHTQANALLPHIHYAPLHVKGITTTIPADGTAKKQKRMEEVRAKRRSAKERKKLARAAA